MHRIVVTLVVVVALMAGPATTHAGPAFSFASSWSHGFNNAYDFTNGWGFTLDKAINVNALGVYDLDANGLAGSHDVGLWEYECPGGLETCSHTLLASATVAAGTGAPLEGWFRYTSIIPVVLVPEKHYVVGAEFKQSAGDLYTNAQNSLAFGTGITFDNFVSYALAGAGTGALAAPDRWDGWAYMDANFSYAPVEDTEVPEPTSLVLLGTGLVVAARAGRRARRASK